MMSTRINELLRQPVNLVDMVLRQDGFIPEQEMLSNNILNHGEYKNFKMILYKHHTSHEMIWCVFGIDVTTLQSVPNAQHVLLGAVEV